MYFLVTGASGVGKSTVRERIGPEFSDDLDIAEIGMLGSDPQWDIAWRHRMVERSVQRALDARRAGKSFLLCGDPVPPGEVWAAPSASRLETLHVCLLDANAATQTARLQQRGDDLTFIERHIAFADWMRRHVVDRHHLPEVMTQNAWPEMRWERHTESAETQPPWTTYIIETSELPPEEVARLVARWLRERLMADKTSPSSRVSDIT